MASVIEAHGRGGNLCHWITTEVPLEPKNQTHPGICVAIERYIRLLWATGGDVYVLLMVHGVDGQQLEAGIIWRSSPAKP